MKSELLTIGLFVYLLYCQQIFDKFLPLLKDANSKVNLHALQTMLQVTPLLKDAMTSVISMTVEQVVPNLSSKNKEIHTAAAEILDSYIEHIGQHLYTWTSRLQLFPSLNVVNTWS